MVTLAFLIAACLDPVQAALVLALVIAYRGPLPIVAAGTAAALITETVMTLAAADYVWGELIAPRLVAALAQAAVSVLAVWAVRSAARSAGAALGIGRLAADGSAALDVLEPRPVSPRMALWHMRSYARRRISELRGKKNAALDCESQ
jgi:hypothetical protein